MKIKNKEKIKIKIGIIILIICIFLTCIFSNIIGKTFHLMHDGIKTIGIVTDLESEESDDTTVYKPKVKYTCNGIEQEQWHQSSSSEYNYRIGTTIRIYCNPDYPNDFLIKSNINYLILICPLLITLIAIIYVIKTLTEEYKKAKLKKYLKNFGIKTKGTIKNISTQKNPSSIGYYTIIASDGNRDYISDKIYSNIRYLIKKGDEVEILIDPLNSNKYYINIEEILEKQVDELCVKDYYSGKYIQINDNLEQNTGIINVVGDIIGAPNNLNNINHNLKDKQLSKCLGGTGIIGIIIGLLIGIICIAIGIYMYKDGKDSSVIIIIGIIIIIITLIKLYKNNKKKRYIENLKTNGIKLNAIISEINKVNGNRQTGYVILAVNGNNIYKSPKIYAYVPKYIKEGDNITIFIDKQNNKKYYMDLDDIKPNQTTNK